MASPSLDSVEPILDTLREVSAGSTSTATSKSPPGALFARLKAVNRSSNAAIAKRRETTAEARNKINDTNLGLQNLMYERRYLEKEIEKCRSFAFIYQDVSLHSLDEFMALAPEELRGPEVLSDEHQLMLNRLKFELAERERLEARRRALVEERDAILAETKSFQNEVDKLSDPFEEIERLTRSMQERIHQLVPQLPLPSEAGTREDTEPSQQDEDATMEATNEDTNPATPAA